jgi:hypothetical protein
MAKEEQFGPRLDPGGCTADFAGTTFDYARMLADFAQKLEEQFGQGNSATAKRFRKIARAMRHQSFALWTEGGRIMAYGTFHDDPPPAEPAASDQQPSRLKVAG